MAVLRVGALPDGALAAAARFYGEALAGLRDALENLRNQSPLPFGGGAGGGSGPFKATPPVPESPRPNPSAEGQGLEGLTVVFPPADHTHRAWRLAAVQQLAREYAPIRVNAVAGAGEKALAAAVSYLGGAEGVTGQLLLLDDTGAGEVLFSPA